LATTLSAQGAITGTVLENGKPVSAASVSAERSGRTSSREGVTAADGRFHLAPLTAGLYTVTVRKVGYRPAELIAVRVAEGQTVNLGVSLTQAPRQLSTIRVVASPTSVNASTPELTQRLDRDVTSLIPSARDASSLIALVPGARKEQLWGGVPGVSNDYRIDGMSMNHPGVGGDFLSLSVDWIDALEVRGLGAGAEDGNFQGGIINAITKTGTNDRRLTVRSNYESARLTSTNVRPGEEGVEQAGRYEVAGEALGPIARDKLFYFVGGQMVRRDLRAPNLTTAAPRDFQSFREEHLDARALGKLTWLPALGQRVDGLVGLFRADVEHAGINGIDDPMASVRARKPTLVYELGWTNAARTRNAIDVKLAGFTASESRLGYQGPDVPGVQLLQPGRLPSFQNAAFDERSRASSVSGRATWRLNRNALGAEHQLVLGADMSHTWWRDERTRNGGVSWRPYSFVTSNFDPTNAATWGITASDWGGEIHLDSDAQSAALFAQDYIALGNRLIVTPGVRYGRWSGYLRPRCASATSSCERFEAVHTTAVDPRLGVVWDVTGRSTLALKAHWGRYHQGMVSLLFDRARGADVYTNHRMYYSAPAFTDSRATFTTRERDDTTSGFSRYFGEEVLDETGRVEGYKQPYVEQTVLGLEKSLGPRWKAEVLYTQRQNRDIVGLVDRNRSTNYSPIFGLRVDDQFATGRTLDANGKPLVLPMVYASNKDLKEQLLLCAGVFNAPSCPTNIAGYTLSSPLLWNPDFVLTTIPEARRRYEQLTLLVRTDQTRWRGEGSITSARLRGNVPGVTGHGTTGTRFSAGPFAKPNESINDDGPLPDALELEGKVWLAVRLPRSLEGGILYTHTLGERFTAAFQFDGRYAYTDSLGRYIPPAVFRSLLGQTVFVEPRGSRHYASRDVVDLHLEWRSPKRAVVMFDLFNALGSDALTSVNAVVGNQIDADPTSYFMATRQRVSPRTLRLGVRVD
jgi:hypothetical protein